MENLNLTPAMEDYLGAIFLIEKENKVARVSDIGRRLNVKKASVVSAVANLSRNGLLIHEKYGYITMTENGRLIAEFIDKKHNVIYDFLINLLKVDEEKAKKEACLIEHSLSRSTVEKLIVFSKRVKKEEEKAPAAEKPAKRKKTAKMKSKKTGTVKKTKLRN